MNGQAIPREIPTRAWGFGEFRICRISKALKPAGTKQHLEHVGLQTLCWTVDSATGGTNNSLQRRRINAAEYNCSYRRFAQAPHRFRRLSSNRKREIVSASETQFSSHSTPLCSDKTICCKAPLRKDTVGTPRAMASTTLRPNDSRNLLGGLD